MTKLNSGSQIEVNVDGSDILIITGGSNSSGIVYRINEALGGTNSLQSWTIAPGTNAPIGPFKNSTRYLVVCNSGSLQIENLPADTQSPIFAKDASGKVVGLVDQDGLTVALGAVTGVPIANIIPSTISSIYARTKAKLDAVKARTGNFKIARIGDSTEMGAWANAGVENNGNRVYCPSQTMASALNSVNYPAIAESFWGDNNVVAMAGTTPLYDPRITTGAGWGSSGTATQGGKVLNNTTTTNALSFAPMTQCDTFDVWVMCDTGTGTFQMTRTGDTGSGTLSSINAGGNLPVKFTFTGALNSNALNFSRVTGAIYLIGIDAYNSAQKSVRVWNMGWTSGQSTDVSATSSPTSPLNSLAYTLPDLVFISIGINDWRNNISVATYTANLQKMVTAILPYADIIFETPFPNAVSVKTLAFQKTYVDAMKAVALTNNLAVNDRFEKWQSWEIQNAVGNYQDTIHPNKVGYAAWGQSAAVMLLSL